MFDGGPHSETVIAERNSIELRMCTPLAETLLPTSAFPWLRVESYKPYRNLLDIRCMIVYTDKEQALASFTDT